MIQHDITSRSAVAPGGIQTNVQDEEEGGQSVPIIDLGPL